jgi:hypothetical protein
MKELVDLEDTVDFGKYEKCFKKIENILILLDYFSTILRTDDY